MKNEFDERQRTKITNTTRHSIFFNANTSMAQRGSLELKPQSFEYFRSGEIVELLAKPGVKILVERGDILVDSNEVLKEADVDPKKVMPVAEIEKLVANQNEKALLKLINESDSRRAYDIKEVFMQMNYLGMASVKALGEKLGIDLVLEIQEKIRADE